MNFEGIFCVLLCANKLLEFSVFCVLGKSLLQKLRYLKFQIIFSPIKETSKKFDDKNSDVFPYFFHTMTLTDIIKKEEKFTQQKFCHIRF